MKRSQIILFALAILIFGAIYMRVVSNKKSYEKNMKEETKTVFVATKTVKNKPHNVTLNSYGQISPITELMISFEVQGKLIQGNKRLKPGVKFAKGEILYSIDQEEMKYLIASQKMTFKSIIAQAMPDITLDFPKEVQKWLNFLDEIQAGLIMPELPPFSNKKERLFWTTRNMLTQYYNLKSQEERALKYTYVAPFSGTVVEVYAEPGSIVNPGVQVAKIARTGDFELKVPIALEDLQKCKEQESAMFTDPEGKLIATGKVVRISDVVNQRTQSADVFYSVTPVDGALIYNGQFLNVSIDAKTVKNAVILPRTALKDREVLILTSNTLKPITIHIEDRFNDSIYVTGLSDGQEVLLEHIGGASQGITYKKP